MEEEEARVSYVVRRPFVYCCVRVSGCYGLATGVGHGIAKQSRVDPWNVEIGKVIARTKAEAEAYREYFKSMAQIFGRLARYEYQTRMEQASAYVREVYPPSVDTCDEACCPCELRDDSDLPTLSMDEGLTPLNAEALRGIQVVMAEE